VSPEERHQFEQDRAVWYVRVGALALLRILEETGTLMLTRHWFLAGLRTVGLRAVGMGALLGVTWWLFRDALVIAIVLIAASLLADRYWSAR
jgi:hypothetical protein